MSETIIIDPGHGGTDPGASGHGIREKDWALEISLYQHKRLKELGAKVGITRTSDKTLDSGPRTNLIKGKYDLCISNHWNAFNGKARGIETIHSIYGGKTFATNLANALVKATELPLRRVFTRRGKSGDYYFMHRMTGSTTTVIIEYGFIDNKQDNDWFKNKDNFYKAAEAVIEVVCQQIGVKYIAPDGKVTVPPSKPTPAPSKPKPSTSKWTKVSGNWSGQTLRRGQYGKPVRQLQELLASKHYYPNKSAKNNGIDGYFGADTEDATRRYQSMFADLAVDGMAGRNTYNKLKGSKSVSKPKPKPKPTTAWTGQVLRQGDRGDAVRQLQNMLAKKYFYPDKGAKNNGVDGIYGAKTKNAVERYQLISGLSIDGIAGRATYNSLNK